MDFFFPFLSFRCFLPSIPTLSLPVAYLFFHSFLSPDRAGGQGSAWRAKVGRRAVLHEVARGASASGAAGGQARGNSAQARRATAAPRRARWAPAAQGEAAHGAGSARKAEVAGEAAWTAAASERRQRAKRRVAATQCARPGWRAAAHVRYIGRCFILLPRGANAFGAV
jgi:hypothetical protein